MDDLPRRALCDLIASYGRDLSREPWRLRGLLKDQCGGRVNRREVRALLGAQDEGVATDLLSPPHGMPAEAHVALLTKRLQDELGIAEDLARWAVESWALALGVAKPASPAPSPPTMAPTGAPSPRRSAPPPGSTLVVADDGSGDYLTISEAVARAAPGTRIIVKPGFYRESINLDRDVEIVGDGPVDDILVETMGEPCLFLNAKNALVSGLSFHARAAAGASFAAIVVGAGRSTMVECEISSDSAICVSIVDLAATPTLRACGIKDGMGVGISIDSSAPTVEDCTIAGHRLSGVFVTHSANPTLRGLVVSEVQEDGIVVTGDGTKGRIENCEISQVRVGLRIQRGADPTVRQCQIHECEEEGIYAETGCLGRIEVTDIFDNSGAGVHIEDGANPYLRGCQINNNGAAGISVDANGLGRVVECDLTGNGYGAWDLYDEDAGIRRRGNIE